jgi:hypothetical protein
MSTYRRYCPVQISESHHRLVLQPIQIICLPLNAIGQIRPGDSRLVICDKRHAAWLSKQYGLRDEADIDTNSIEELLASNSLERNRSNS